MYTDSLAPVFKRIPVGSTELNLFKKELSNPKYKDTAFLSNALLAINRVPKGSKKDRDLWRKQYPFARAEVKDHYLKLDGPLPMPLDDYVVQQHMKRAEILKSARDVRASIILPKYQKYVDKYPGIISVSNCYFPDPESDHAVKINTYACAIGQNVLVCPTEDISPDDSMPATYANREFTVYYQKHHYHNNLGKLNFAINHVPNKNEKLISFRPWHNVALIILPDAALPLKSVFPVRLTSRKVFKLTEINQDLPSMNGMPILDKDGVLLGIYTRNGANVFNRAFSEFLRYGLNKYVTSHLQLMNSLRYRVPELQLK